MGKSSGPNYNVVGADITHLGEGQFTVNNGEVLQLNRKSSDGTIVNFRKDGTTVGSIGTYTGYTRLGGNTNSGFIFRNGQILPWNNSTSDYADGTQDLGTGAGARFKDLYLSGGVNVGVSEVITSGRAITNCTGITLTGGSISSYGSVTAGLGSFLVGTRGKMGQVSNDLFVCSTTADHSGLKFANGAIHPTDNTGTQSDSAQIDLGSGSYRFSDIYARNSTILTSDRNEKQNIEELSDAEQRVAVRAKGLLRKFKWKDAVAEKGDDARIHFGIVAQDLQAAFVAEGLDAGDYGVFISNTWTNEDGEEQTRMGVRYGELLAFIISAI